VPAIIHAVVEAGYGASEVEPAESEPSESLLGGWGSTCGSGCSAPLRLCSANGCSDSA